ncbi:homoserine kinase [Crassaminicella thermophila]|uniref:Homoserine kinase n=1 Tax=Crassaminicella thermophila TaxID=2599308 RepID=A0A5C0SD43_CRATE|nr:homoserine kinase [Crassaminicella thermophila]QEK11134.1 homoserine kinase [Crassaminicella thermophila]
MFKVKVPATTANMGPGYDVMGMALTLYNEFEVQEKAYGIECIGFGDIPLEENLIYTSMNRALNMYGYKKDGLRIIAKEINIPISRGLGSSAACIIGGIMIANKLMDNILSKEDIIRIGTSIEGHPDNIVPAVTGGMTVSIYEEDEVIYSKVNVPKNLRFVVMIPKFTVSTHEARKVVPESYSKNDCIFNISRVAMLVASMNNGEIEKLRIATEDKVHQPYRSKLIPNIDKIFKHARYLGSKSEVISGSGSTLMVMIDKENIDFKEKMQGFLKNIQGSWQVRVLEVDTEGAKIL